MINKNFDDIAKLAKAISDVEKEFEQDSIRFSPEDLVVNLTVSETELSIIDRDLYELTKAHSDREYMPAKKVEANVGGVQFVITARQ